MGIDLLKFAEIAGGVEPNAFFCVGDQKGPYFRSRVGQQIDADILSADSVGLLDNLRATNNQPVRSSAERERQDQAKQPENGGVHSSDYFN